MFADYVFQYCSAGYRRQLMLINEDQLLETTHYDDFFASQGFAVIPFENDLHFRVNHDSLMESDQQKAVIIVKPGSYVPYDMQKRFAPTVVSIKRLFPKLNAQVLTDHTLLSMDLISLAYERNYDDLSTADRTNSFLVERVFSKENVLRYLSYQLQELKEKVLSATTYVDWFSISNMKAGLDVLATQYELDTHTDIVQQPFLDFITKKFGKLSAEISLTGPVLVSRVMEYMRNHSERFAIVVMDGMSQFDWTILSHGFVDIPYQKTEVFAMIPTTTSISRQCLLSNKFPSQLISPWTQSQEKKEFTDCAQGLGFMPGQIGYDRGYDADFGSAIRCAAVIINDIDDMVHGQKQGRIGMYNDVGVLCKQTKLRQLVDRLLGQGFDVYITADHGNTPCTGIGKLVKTGVEVETKSRRMVVLKDIADKQAMIDLKNMIDYPKYYLNKAFDYLICQPGESLDATGEQVMSHGGITIDEVIIPFVAIKAGDYHG